jgi:ribose transport system substrate-binding protein
LLRFQLLGDNMRSVRRPAITSDLGDTVRAKPRYQLETVARACSVLRVFSNDEETLSLADIVGRTGLEKTIAFRIVRTLEEQSFLRKVSGRRYSTNVQLRGSRRFRIGYAGQTSDSPFATAVEESLRRSAARSQVDLIVFDNRYSEKVALRCAKQLIAERVDLAIEFQTHQKISPLISSMFQAAQIPMISVDIPHPGAIFYGVDNYSAGLAAGRALVKWCKNHWHGQADELLLLELEIAGSLPYLRMSGVEAAVRQTIPAIKVVRMETRGEFARTLVSVRNRLRSTRAAAKTLIAGVNDPSVFGALRAFEEAGRLESCAAMGLGAIPEARSELRRPGRRLIGSIAFFPERYGDDLIQLAMDILQKRNVPPAVFAKHELLTRENVDSFYPGDSVLSDAYEKIR